MIRLQAILWLVTLLAIAQAQLPDFCVECEQEIWEQVPCSNVPTTTTAPVTTTQSPVQPVSTTTTSAPSKADYTNANHIPASQPQSTYNKCYCECKLGCKEFCYKVAVAPPQQQITQYTATKGDAPNGQLKYSHAHQRKYYPAAQPSSYGQSAVPYPYAQTAPIPAPAPASAAAGNNINAPNYTLEDFAQLLSGNQGNKLGYAASPQLPNYAPDYNEAVSSPQLSAAATASATPMQTVAATPYVNEPKLAPAAAYALPQGNKLGYAASPQLPSYAPVYSEAVGSPQLSASATASATPTQSVAAAQRKTPYANDQKLATAAPYALPPPATESYAVPPEEEAPYPPAVTDAPYALPPTEPYAATAPAAKYADNVGTNAIKPDATASNFDVAIDNYLKDFGYGNQVIGPYANY